MNLKRCQFNFDQILDSCFVTLIAVVFGYNLVSLIPAGRTLMGCVGWCQAGHWRVEVSYGWVPSSVAEFLSGKRFDDPQAAAA